MPNLFRADFVRHKAVTGLERVTIRQKFGNHTVALLDYKIDNRHEYLLPAEDTPLIIRWGSGATGVRPYYGYVNHYETAPDDTGTAYIRMVTLGTSKKMNAASPSSWQGATRSLMARDIAARHRLASVVHDHPYVMDNWATGTRTDFQALQALAQETGYRLWVDGPTLYLLDPTKVLRTASSMTTPRIDKSQIKDVKVLGGSYIPGDIEPAKRRIQFGLDYRTNEFFEATSGTVGSPTEVIGSTATTYSEAQEIADAADRKQQDKFALRMSIEGDARLHPGSLIRVPSGRVNSDQAGLWLVAEALHEITRSDFTTNIVATRGAEERLLSRVPSTVRGMHGLSQAVVRDGVTWEAALQEHVHA